jgi:hypothetical protein
MFRVIITTTSKHIHEIDDFKSTDATEAITYFLRRVQRDASDALPIGWTASVAAYGDDYDDRPPIGHSVHNSRF